MSAAPSDSRYAPPTAALWKGRCDGPGAPRYHEIIQCVNFLDSPTFTRPGIALAGFACDEGVKRNLGRPGADQGPAAIRQALAKLPVHHHLPLVDIGDITCPDGQLEESQKALGDLVASLIKQGLVPIVIGGGHESAWGTFQGIAAAYPAQSCAIVNFDAHYDLRPLPEGYKGSSGTSFTQIAEHMHAAQLPFDYTCLGIQRLGNSAALFQKAKELNVVTVLADELHEGGTEKSIEIAEEILVRADRVFLSLCLDVFAAPFAPGVSAPQPLGIFPWHVLPALKLLASSGKVVGFNLAEMSPAYDRDGTTALLSAQMIGFFLDYFGAE